MYHLKADNVTDYEVCSWPWHQFVVGKAVQWQRLLLCGESILFRWQLLQLFRDCQYLEQISCILL